jgi:hypothetical protein
MRRAAGSAAAGLLSDDFVSTRATGPEYRPDCVPVVTSRTRIGRIEELRLTRAAAERDDGQSRKRAPHE